MEFDPRRTYPSAGCGEVKVPTSPLVVFSGNVLKIWTTLSGNHSENWTIQIPDKTYRPEKVPLDFRTETFQKNMQATIGQYADYCHLEWTLDPVRVRNPLWYRLVFCEPKYVWNMQWRTHDRLKEFQEDPEKFQLLPLYGPEK